MAWNLCPWYRFNNQFAVNYRGIAMIGHKSCNWFINTAYVVFIRRCKVIYDTQTVNLGRRWTIIENLCKEISASFARNKKVHSL